MHMSEAEKRIEGSSLFDAAWYCRHYPVKRDGALQEYLSEGWKLGRDPSPDFSTQLYLRQYEDVAQAGICPLEHYVLWGREEGRMCFPSEHTWLRKISAWKRVDFRCPVCGKRPVRYAPLSECFRNKLREYGIEHKFRPEMCNEVQYGCPFCGASDRERIVAEYFSRNLPKGAQGEFLHIAPSQALKSFLEREYPGVRQTTADLFMEGVDRRLDVTSMPEIADDSFDFFLCLHVLEHVSDDRAAMRELRRILKPGGWEILVVPIDLNAKQIDEEWGLSEGENWRRFGQGDYVRRYSHAGYVQRLKECGFDVQQCGRRYFGSRCFRQLGMQKTAVLYVVSKSGARR